MRISDCGLKDSRLLLKSEIRIPQFARGDFL
jgi:hypothetical protein